MNHIERMTQIEHAAAVQYKTSGHCLTGPVPKAQRSARTHLVAQVACLIIVVGVVVCVGLILGAI